MKNVFVWLEGKKTYLTAAIGVVISGMYSMGYITPDTYEAIIAVLGFLGVASVRHAITKAK